MRAIFIGAGIAILQQFSWVIYVFGGFLIFTGLRMLKPSEEEADLENNFVLKLTKKLIPSTDKMDSNHFFTKINGKWLATPLFITLIFVEFSDVIFALDSIPAIIGITTDPFLVFTSNVFAILGLRSLYFALKGFADMFHYLKYGLAVILVFIGTKMCIASFYHVPVWVTMMVIFGVLIISMLVSLAKQKRG